MTASEAPLSVEVDRAPGGVAILRIAGELDLASASLLEAAVADLRCCESRIVLDGTGLTFVDSTGLRALLVAQRSIHEAGAAFAMVPSMPLSRLLEITDMGTVLSVSPTMDEAIEAVQSAASPP